MSWIAGDAEDILRMLGLSVSSFNLSQIQRCMDELEAISPTSKAHVRDLIADYEAAETALAALNAAGTGKTLVKADVLEWQVDQGGDYKYSPLTEMQRLREEMMRYFGDCMGISAATGYSGTTQLIRS